ncbi:S49 family peptidase [Denitratisoma oestradiolicum]|uniref:Protease IV n=1 Tax=Denitratisoma oestradiolicum TaxID=311182 RepID=A0A6S6Y6G8_9PROT|nr:S49 family peptidase [Denitratisoma oestradiolicum]TWO80989.1 phage tail protein [Denitratisoma oestradiolicum]CAB1371142.1 Protease IV [Denitratisoma oestradiolicum]
MTDLPYLASRLYGTPLLIARPKLEVILGVVARKLAGDILATPPPATVDAGMTGGLQNLEGIAIIPILGTLVRRSSYIGAASGLTSYHEIEAMAEAAFTDPQVRAVLLEIDSSGGEAGGVFDLAQRLRTLAQTSGKPLWAIADEAALSAAYAIACAADRLWLTRTAEVGSIGVVAVHVDESVADAKAGMTYTFLHAGAHKVDGHPHAPLPAPVAADIQTDIDQLHDQFIALVAGFRRLTPEVVRATEARVYRGEAAIQAGLADQLGTTREALTALQRQLALSAGRSLRNKAAALSAARTTPRSQLSQQEISMNDHNLVTPVDDAQENTAPTPAQSPQTPPPLDEAAITAQVEQRLRRQLAELTEIAAQAKRLGVTVDPAQALARGVTPDALRQSVLKQAAERDVAQDIVAEAPAPASTKPQSVADSPLVKAAQAYGARK